MQAPITKNLELVQKTTKVYEIQFKKDGQFVDITDWIVFLTVKEKMTDSDDDAIIKKTIVSHTDAPNGKTTIELDSTDTDITPKSYVFDIKYKDDSTPANIGIIIQGKLTVTRIVTQRESA